MRRIFVALAAVLLYVGYAQAALPNYNKPRAKYFATDSLSFRMNGNPATIDSLIGAAVKDTTGVTRISGLKDWAVSWIYTDAPGPSASTWSVLCTLQVSLDSTTWHSVAPGPGIWAISASSDTNIFQVLKSDALADTAAGVANGALTKQMIDAAAFARFILTVANSADDTVYLKAIQGKVWDKD